MTKSIAPFLDFPTRIRHANAKQTIAYSEDIKGGRGKVATLVELYELIVLYPDFLEPFTTIVYVTSEDKDYQLIDAALAHFDAGWRNYTVDLSGKVDKVAGKQLSTEDYTTADKSKLANMVQHFKGKYTALSNAPANGSDGDYIYIDAGVGSDALEYIWDSTDNAWKPSSNSGASSFGQLSGQPTDNAALNTALAAKVDKVTGKGLSTNDYATTDLQKVANVPANTVSELAAKVDKVAGKSLSTNDYTTADLQKVANVPANTVSELAAKVDKVAGKSLSTNDYTTADLQKVAGITPNATANAAANTAETIAGTDNTKFVTSFNLAAWWSDIKTRVQTITNDWNFTGKLKQNGYDVLTTFNTDISTKLNVEGNAGLTGDEGRVSLFSAAGKIISNQYIKFIALTRELQIGAVGLAGKLTVFSNVFNLEIQDNIADGQSFITIPAGQDKALQIKDKNSNVLMTFGTLANGQRVVINSLQVFDQSLGMPVWRGSAGVTSAGANTRVYGLKSDATAFSLKLDVDTQTLAIFSNFKVQNNTGSICIYASVRSFAKRVGGVITVINQVPNVYTDNGTSGFTIGFEATADGLGVRPFFTPGASDNTAYAGGFYDITYSY